MRCAISMRRTFARTWTPKDGIQKGIGRQRLLRVLSTRLGLRNPTQSQDHAYACRLGR